MLNDDNSKDLIKEFNPMKVTKISDKGTFACRRAMGEGYFDEVKNRTYIAYNERGMDIYLAFFDHEKKEWSNSELVYKCDLFSRWDYHDYVSMIQDLNGNPMFFYHIHSSHAYMIKLDENGKYKRAKICDNNTAYPAPIRYKNSIYYFYSENKEISYPYRPLRFIRSDDNGETWTEPKDIIDSAKKTPDKIDEVYQSDVIFLEANENFPDRFIISFTMWGGEKHAFNGKGAYSVMFYPHDEKCYDLNGNCLQEVVDYDMMIEKCCVAKGRISQFSEFRHSTYGPISVADDKGNVLVIHGHRDENTNSLYVTKCEEGKFVTNEISNEMWNVKDARTTKEGIDIAVAHGDSVVIWSKNHDESDFCI